MEKIVVVFGSSRTRDEKHLRDAEQMGRLLVGAGYAVGSGGYEGIMEAVSRGAFHAGGHVIGYTTDQFGDLPPSPWLSEERRAPDIHLRIKLMLEEGDAFVAMWGGIGTLAEVTMAWNVAQIAALQGRTPKPLILVGDNWPPLVECIGTHTEIGSSVLALPVMASSPEAAVEQLSKLLG